MIDPNEHKTAWDSACYRREYSQLARCYIEAVEVLRMAKAQFPNNDGWLELAGAIGSAAEMYERQA